ncbi:MAG TPA: BREX-2 system adenine-specific DNA-methyltransferase PglX [Streptosporangiaceae bacterium]|nr:BREX-2 system adenine-specific DNA-methyltransferase PglX [Streptosporangiaceae bacterium]
MTATAALTTDLQRQVLRLEEDLRDRLQADTQREGQWKQEHQRAVDKERTAASWVAWRDDRITQAAVAWVLTSVFIRFCEDNALVSPGWIAGPENRRQEALDAQLAYFRAHPEDTDREWLKSAIDYLAGLPATKALVESHSALYLVSPSGDAVTRLLDFWRTRREDGALVHDLNDPSLSTRFLGDLYQDLSQHAKDTYALLQTPVFVEEFILDRTLEPALKERPLEGFKLIDPTCGSGHFLLGAFDRLLDRWNRHAPGLETQARVQAALDAIHGVDLNPFAVAVARFRLTVAALKASGLTSLETAPAFTFHLAVGDSLIHGPDPDVLPGMSNRSAFMPFTYTTEDGPLLLSMLEEGTYDVVVGNPPYITPKDRALNRIYRSKYSDVCKGKYALTVPFMRLFFALAKGGPDAGWTGQITSNSFMKREFGVPLIEKFLVTRDLRLVADTSGAYIPGHGTPTLILVGRNQVPVSSTVRAVLGVRGEPAQPEDPAKATVWSSIIEHINDPSWDDRWVTITDLSREHLVKHPWTLAGGGALELLEQMSVDCVPTCNIAESIGITAFTLEDEVYVSERSSFRTRHVVDHLREMVLGEGIRDWSSSHHPLAIFPYDDSFQPIRIEDHRNVFRWMWPYRANLANNILFGGRTKVQAGLLWSEYGRLTAKKLRSPLSVTFAAVATHNHFAFDRGGKVFKQSALVIKLPSGASEDEYLALTGILNSSTACFWLKQKSYAKTGADNTSGGGNRWSPEPWYSFYDFNATTLQDYPVPKKLPLRFSQMLDSLASELIQHDPSTICAKESLSSDALTAARSASQEIRAHMVGIQEELDWEVYQVYGFIEENLTYADHDPPSVTPGQRAFEIALAQAVQAGHETTAWFTHHGYSPVTEIPAHWPPRYREVVQRRVDAISSNPWIRLLEQPEYKRRWAQAPWEKRIERAIQDWLLDRLEGKRFWFDAQGRPVPRSVAQLADEVSRDADMVLVLVLWEGRPDVPVTQSLERLLVDEAVPFLAAYRYKESGLRKRVAWEETWASQRREDASEMVGPIPVPPKYTSADFRKNSYWQARGKLDVPKERFILYPDAGRETDPTPLLGWAGWDQAQQSLALSLIIGEREKDGWADDRLEPLVAGLAEVQPWVDQWHSEVDPDYGVSLAAFCREQLTARAAQVGKTLGQLAEWRPAPATRGRRARKPE